MNNTEYVFVTLFVFFKPIKLIKVFYTVKSDSR